jgi:hypothetical protein
MIFEEEEGVPNREVDLVLGLGGSSAILEAVLPLALTTAVFTNLADKVIIGSYF